MPLLRAFGDDFARAVGIEAIDHHPVEAGQRAHLARAFVEEGGHVGGLVEPGDHGAHRAGGVAISCSVVGSAFDHDAAVAHVQRDVEALRRRRQRAAEHALDRVGRRAAATGGCAARGPRRR